MSARQPEVCDLSTAEGCVEWVQHLPSENLRVIAARPVDQFNAYLVFAAEGELNFRECGSSRGNVNPATDRR